MVEANLRGKVLRHVAVAPALGVGAPADIVAAAFALVGGHTSPFFLASLVGIAAGRVACGFAAASIDELAIGVAPACLACG